MHGCMLFSRLPVSFIMIVSRRAQKLFCHRSVRHRTVYPCVPLEVVSQSFVMCVMGERVTLFSFFLPSSVCLH